MAMWAVRVFIPVVGADTLCAMGALSKLAACLQPDEDAVLQAAALRTLGKLFVPAGAGGIAAFSRLSDPVVQAIVRLINSPVPSVQEVAIVLVQRVVRCDSCNLIPAHRADIVPSLARALHSNRGDVEACAKVLTTFAVLWESESDTVVQHGPRAHEALEDPQFLGDLLVLIDDKMPHVAALVLRCALQLSLKALGVLVALGALPRMVPLLDCRQGGTDASVWTCKVLNRLASRCQCEFLIFSSLGVHTILARKLKDAALGASGSDGHGDGIGQDIISFAMIDRSLRLLTKIGPAQAHELKSDAAFVEVLKQAHWQAQPTVTLKARSRELLVETLGLTL
jgi:hypothetical protein